MQGRGGEDKVKAETKILFTAISGIVVIVIVTIFSIRSDITHSYKNQIISLKRQLKVCQEIPLPKCETLEDRIKWCESKIMHHADAINNLMSKQYGLE